MTKSKFGKPLCRSIMAVAMMMLSLQAMAYDFSYTHQGKTLYYNITSGNRVAVTYYNYGSNNYVSGDVVIPSTVRYNGTTYSVTSIGWDAFKDCSGLTSVTIPNSVTSIGEEAFRDCSSLSSVTIPNSVTSIGDCAFHSCSGLTSITIPTGVTSIGWVAFYGCSGLTSVTIPNSVTSIGESAFKGCSGLTSVSIPNSVTSIGGHAFEDCSSLTSVILPNSLTSIGESAFRDCSRLTSVTIPNSVTSIGGWTFSGCSGLTSITIPTGVTSIGESAFGGCSGLTSVSIPNSVTSIGGSAFSGCRGLTSVTIPNSVTSIGGWMFSGCSGLTSITIPTGVTSIGESAFGGCSGLTSVSIPNSVTSIGGSAFSGCRGLTSVTIPNSVTSIGGWMFSGCSGLTSITIPTGVTSIGESAFGGCSGLTSITIPTGVTSIGGWTFSGCSGLTSITIPTGVTSIGESAFSGCSGLTSVTIPTGVTSIGKYAFDGCSGLTSVTIPNSVTSIGRNAFYRCRGLTTLNFNAINCQDFEVYRENGNNYYPFSGTSLTTVNIGDSVQRIPAYFVIGCRGLTSVTIGTGVTSIRDSAFYGCSGLTTLNFNAINCQDFSSSYHPFSGTSLTTVNIGDSVQRIPAYFVSGCSGLTSVTIPNSVTSIGGYAFSGCNNLSSITSLAMTPPAISSNNEFPYPNICTVTVPCGSLEAYTASTCYWSVYFPQRITAGFPFELNISANDSTLGTVVITTGESCAEGVLTAIPELCYRFVAWNDGNTTNPRTITLTQDTTLTANFERAVYTQEIHHAICEGSAYTENGFNVSEAGTYTQTLQTIDGCDSIVTLNLAINPVASTNLTAAICEGTTYTENGFNASETGTYTQNLQSVNGCDSIITLTLTVNPVESTNLTVAICEGTTYTENGFNVSEAGTHTLNLQTVNGCDSIVTLNLTVNPAYSIAIDASINEGETYEENGFSESEAGTYVHTLQAENGCDSVITLNLTVNSSLNDVVANAIEVSLYPNPARAYTTLKVEGLKEQTPVYLFDIQGRKLKEYIMNIGQEALRIYLGDLPKGVYTIMIGNTTKKLIVE